MLPWRKSALGKGSQLGYLLWRQYDRMLRDLTLQLVCVDESNARHHPVEPG